MDDLELELEMMTIDGIRVPKTKVLYTRLITERKSVLFVGEGDFSFTVAFAALRKCRNRNPDTWSDIFATRYEPVGSKGGQQFVGEMLVGCKPMPSLSLVKANCIASCAQYALQQLQKMDRTFHSCYDAAAKEMVVKIVDDCLSKCDAIKKLPPIPKELTWKYGIDARAIPLKLIEGCDVIWFQCPWVKEKKQIRKLVSHFLRSVARRTKEGVYVCIGITSRHRYFQHYHIHQAYPQDDYLFLGVDTELIEKVLSFGYHHQAIRDIHRKIIDEHATWVFRRV